MKARRGILIPCLFLLALLFVICLGQLARQPYQYRAARAALTMAQARALAEAGLEDFKIKWNHDLQFPPPPPDGTKKFSYVEEVRDFQTQELQGYYRVTVDSTWKEPPYQVYRVTSEGLAGPGDDPAGIYGIQALMDLRPDPRPSGPARLGQWIEWREQPP